MSVKEIDIGTGYDVPNREYKANLVEVDRGTPMGELMRRYWQPVFTSALLTSDKPQRIRILGEDLIIFRDKSGKPGLVHEHCCHRGTSLYYGRIEEDGIRCCYHGWKFDVKGRCLHQPAEVDGGRNRDRIRQPWYPVEERYGLVYAYMGPPDQKPVLPRWAHLENLAPGEVIDINCGNYGPLSDSYAIQTFSFNWLQAYENIADGPHLGWLHYWHSGDQFGFDQTLPPGSPPPPLVDMTDLATRVVAERTGRGIKTGIALAGPDGQRNTDFIELILPNIAIIPINFDLGYIVPMDNENHLCFLLRRKQPDEITGLVDRYGGKLWLDMSEEEHQRFPSDYEAQGSIGRLPAHNLEHLTQGDAGVGMLRRVLEGAARDVEEGRAAPGVSFDEGQPPLATAASLPPHRLSA